MNATVNSQLLAAELRRLNKVVPTKPAIAILSHVLIHADAGALRFWATDLEVGLSSQCPSHVAEPGVVALPVAKFLALVDQFEDADVAIASDGPRVAVRCNAFASRLQAMPVEDFPAQPEAKGSSSIIDGSLLRRLIAKTRYAVNAVESRYVLKGALLTLAGSVAAMVATDGKRLALAMVGRTGTDARFIVPAKALDALADHAEGDCEVTVGERHLHFSSGDRVLTSRTIDGQFPAYERIIPRDNDLVATVDRVALTAALKRITLVAEQSVATWFDVQPGCITLSASSAEVGSADEVVHVAYDGMPVKVCLNGSYVLDFLSAASNEAVQVCLKDAKGPVMMTDGSDSVGVIMPMRG